MSSLADFLLSQDGELQDDDLLSAPVASLEEELESLRRQAKELEDSFAPKKQKSIVQNESSQGGDGENPQQEPSLTDDFFSELPSVQVYAFYIFDSVTILQI